MNIPINQRLADRIVARAQNSNMGLGDPEEGKSYNLALYSPTVDSLAMLLVGAHFEKYDLVSLFAAAINEIAEQTGTTLISPP